MKPVDFVTLSEAAKTVGVTTRTIQNHIQRGSAPHWERLGREVIFRLPDLLKWKDKHYPEGKPRKGKRRHDNGGAV